MPSASLLLLPDATTVEAARRRLAGWFRQAGIDGAEPDARLLVCAACGIDHLALVRDPDRLVGSDAAVLAGFAARRLGGEPVSRILGRRDFYGLSLFVGAAVLDPRPETEGLVTAALDAVVGRERQPLQILDLGTGSGAVLCALLDQLPDAFGVGVDRSPAACRVAGRNLARHGSRAAVICGDWGAALHGAFDLVVANPPYIARAELPGLPAEVRLFDPLAALDGGADGLDAYRAITPCLGRILAPGGTVAFECGWRQGNAVATLLRAATIVDVEVRSDLAGHDRIVIGHR